MVTAPIALETPRFSTRPRRNWRLRSRTLRLGDRTMMMGVLNVTPDSFSDGGQFADPARAADHALQMLADGADILDIGGESTRPGSQSVESAEELHRVLPVIQRIRDAAPDACLSIDTTKAEVAYEAVSAGCDIVNDVSGMLWDERMAETCSSLGCGVVLMHTRGRPDVWKHLPALAKNSVLPLVRDGLRQRMEAAQVAGIAHNQMVIDPGFGFGKAGAENYALLARLSELSILGLPIAAGVSRKSFLGRTLVETERRLAGPLGGLRWEEMDNSEAAPAAVRGNATLAATTALVLSGAHIVRVHDVRPAVEAVAIADALLNAS